MNPKIEELLYEEESSTLDFKKGRRFMEI